MQLTSECCPPAMVLANGLKSCQISELAREMLQLLTMCDSVGHVFSSNMSCQQSLSQPPGLSRAALQPLTVCCPLIGMWVQGLCQQGNVHSAYLRTSFAFQRMHHSVGGASVAALEVPYSAASAHGYPDLLGWVTFLCMCKAQHQSWYRPE